MIIQHNLSAMNTNRQFGIVNKAQAKSTEKLSSGYKINRAADDAAGLAISEKMRRQIRGLTQGVSNTQDGVSMCQVGDGALAEINDMLHRMTELAVKASNGTLTADDRQAIHDEIAALKEEIDRIGNTTQFNDRYLFVGFDEPVLGPDGTPTMIPPVDFKDIQLPDLSLTTNPFSDDAGRLQRLGIAAKVDKPDHPSDGEVFKLAYGLADTVHINIDGTEITSLLTYDAAKGLYESSPGVISRDFTYGDYTLTQSAKVIDGASEKKYEIAYSFKNNGSSDAKVDFMFNVDTAYNDNDRRDNYYVGGTLLEHGMVYRGNHVTVGDVATSDKAVDGIPDSLSFVDKNDSLAFSQKISWEGANKPDVVVVGHYSSIREWNALSNTGISSTVAFSTGAHNASSSDLGYTLVWNDKEIPAGGSWTAKFYSGIADVTKDSNLAGSGIKAPVAQPLIKHQVDPVWIQSGSEAGQGLWIQFREVDCGTLGILDHDVLTQENAQSMLDATKDALKYISELRSDIGAYQNRLEHTIANESNVVENTTAAESRIRDTDMATEMVNYSLNSILLQAGSSMLAQANQSNQSVLSLLS